MFDDFFAGATQEACMLRDHGFKSWPTEGELVRYVLALQDQIDVLSAAFGVRLVRDWRKQWHVEGVSDVQIVIDHDCPGVA